MGGAFTRGLLSASLAAIALAAPAQAQDASKGFQFLYGSAEGAAISRQAFNGVVSLAMARKAQREAGLPLVQTVLAPGSTLKNPAFEACGDKPLAAVFDVDETMLLNVGFEYWDAGRPAGSTFSFKAWENWERARAIDSAGFPRPVRGKDLFTEAEGSGNKDPRRAAIAQTWCVIAMGGDQLGDFSDLFSPKPMDIHARRATTAAPAIANLWGQGWFVLPNPVYGKGVVGDLDTVFPDASLRWSYSEGKQP